MVPDLKTFTNKGCKMAAQKKWVFGQILTYCAGFFWHQCFPLCLTFFSPTSQSPMSNLFRFLESLGKCNGISGLRFKKLLLIKGVKLPRWNKFFLGILFICSLRFIGLLPPLSEVQCPKFLDFWNLWGKVMERSGLIFDNFCS